MLDKTFPIKLKLTLIFIIFIPFVDGKYYGRCELAKELLNRYNFPKNEIADWICLVNAESSFNTAALSSVTYGYVQDFGLFQINNEYWCSPPNSINVCEMDCEQFLDDDIDDDVACVETIFSIHGFEGWTGWKNKCRDYDNSYWIEDCDLDPDSPETPETPASLIERLLDSTKQAIQSFLTVHKDDPNQNFIVRTLNKISMAMRVILTKLYYF